MRAAQREPRRERRSHFDADGRLTLLEGDADDHELALDLFKAEIRAEVKAIKMLLFGVMASATTATIVGALNLFYQHVPK